MARRASNDLVLQSIIDNLTVYMMVGIVIVIGVSQFNRVAGAVLSALFWTAVAVVGNSAYNAGTSIGVVGFELPRWLFFAICAGFAGMHVFAAISQIRSKRNQAERRRLLADEDG